MLQQRRKVSDVESSDVESPPPRGLSSKFRVMRQPHARREGHGGLSQCDVCILLGGMAVLMTVPLYAIASSLRFSTAVLTSPLTDSRAVYSESVLSAVWQGQHDSHSLSVPSWRTQWADVNRTRLEQVRTADRMATCQSVQGLPSGLPGYRVCLDGEEGAFPLDAQGNAAPGECVVYSFSFAADEGSDLGSERALASLGCEVHAFSPALRYDGAPVSPSLAEGVQVPLPDRAAGTSGSLTLHAVMAGKDEYDPEAAVGGRHPDTLRPEQLWYRVRIGTVLSSLGHDGGVSLLRITGYGGREWSALSDCFSADAGRCGSRFTSLQLELTLEDREGLHADLDIHTLMAWSSALGVMVGEVSAGGLGMKQVDRAPVPAAGTLTLGLTPTDPRFRGNLALNSAWESVKTSVFDGKVPKCVRGTWVKRSLNTIVRMGTAGKFGTAEEYTAHRKAAFCGEADHLAKAQYGADAELHSPECAQQKKEGGDGEGQEEEGGQDVGTQT